MTSYQFKADNQILFMEDDRGKFWIDLQSREIIEDIEEAKNLYAQYGILEQFEFED